MEETEIHRDLKPAWGGGMRGWWVPRTFAQVLRAHIKFSESLSSGHVLCSLECPLALALSSTETWKVFWRSSGIRTKHGWDHPLASASNAKDNMEQIKIALETAGEHWQRTSEHAAHINKRGCKTDYTDRNTPCETVTMVTKAPETMDISIRFYIWNTGVQDGVSIVYILYSHVTFSCPSSPLNKFPPDPFLTPSLLPSLLYST